MFKKKRSGCKEVGVDVLGNTYFELSRTDAFGRRGRIVKYKGLNEPSKVPPLWSAWLRHAATLGEVEAFSKIEPRCRFAPNLTGTEHQTLPSRHALNVTRNKRDDDIYKSWTGS